ncbi:MAG: hypothetical protein CMN30_15615 [Sandaracinus sp.]|nr:hypothetical protein [Sandaracinus sp.]
MPTPIHVTVGDVVLTATLGDGPAARAFAVLLPLELTLSDYHATEKVSPLPKKLPTQGEPPGHAAVVGDITYYAPWGNLAIFYRPFGYAEGLIHLGRFDGGLAPLLQDAGPRIRIARGRSTTPR